MHAMLFMHFVFGTFLVYTGIKTLTADEEDEALFGKALLRRKVKKSLQSQRETYWTEKVMMKFVQDPSQNPMVKWLQEKAPVDLVGSIRL